MHSITLWKRAQEPNYFSNIDRTYPYSEVAYVGDCKLVKIPISLNNLIDHVDYWGEGRVTAPQGSSGFSNCYNINHAYRLVNNGPDRDRKIPNRIPVISETECDTSPYVKNNSVLTVTVMGASIKNSCAADITRIVNNDLGVVIAYGYEPNSEDIANLSEQLKNEGIYHCPSYDLPNKLQEVTLFSNHIIFLNINLIKDELSKLVVNGEYAKAVYISKQMKNKIGADAIKETVSKLLNGDSKDHNRLMSYGYQLWTNDEKDFVRDHFPASFKLIFGNVKVKIFNKKYKQPLKLDQNLDGENDRVAWGDDHGMTGVKVSWVFIPNWIDNKIVFTIFNVDCNMYLKLAVPVDDLGDRKAYGSKDSDSNRHNFIVEPFMRKGTFGFYIINYGYAQKLKLDVTQDSIGDRLLWGHNGHIDESDDEDRFTWIISEW